MQSHTSNGTVEKVRSAPTTLALGLSTFLVLFDVTAVVVAMPAIARDVGLGVTGLACQPQCDGARAGAFVRCSTRPKAAGETAPAPKSRIERRASQANICDPSIVRL